MSSLPMLHGEKLVLQRIDTLAADLSLGTLGFDAHDARIVEAAIAAPHGLVLVTGPTGSGKTLSLYPLLQRLNDVSRNICTIEDPAEIPLDGINPVGVRDKAGLTFATALRAFLRQDSDVIMVGEIRDAETADVALKAAQTGHLVLARLHTNDAPAAVTRLLDIGVAPCNLAGALRLVTAQRLVRTLCPAWRAPCAEPRDVWRAAGIDDGERKDRNERPFVATGCAACHGIGYRGRVGIHPVREISPARRSLIARRSPDAALAAVLGHLADDRERTTSQYAKVRAALTYPAAVLLFAIAITAALLAWVVPTFAQIFAGLGAALPAPTRIVLALSDRVARWGPPAASGTLAAGAALAGLAHRYDGVRLALARTALRAPLADALGALVHATGNAVFDRATIEIAARLQRGERLASAMRATRSFPHDVVQPIAVAEEAGTLDARLADIATLCERIVDDRIDALASLCEPLVIVVLGTLIGALVVAMYLPIVQLGNVV